MIAFARVRKAECAPRKNCHRGRERVFFITPQTRITPGKNAPGYDARVSGAMLYNYFRSYSPTTGRYSQSDPIGLDGGWNRFGYVDADPIGYMDPLGLDRWGSYGYGRYIPATNPEPSFWERLNFPETPEQRALGENIAMGFCGGTIGMAKGLGLQNRLFKNALQRFNDASGLSNAGRALTKHPELVGATKDSLRSSLRTDAAINDAAHDALKNIMRNGETTSPTLGRYGTVTQTQIPGGFGARWGADGRFIGFINP